MSLSVHEFADRMNEVIPLIIKGFSKRQTNELCKGKITLPQFIILDFLDRRGELRMTDLAHFMDVTTAAMTGVIERLVRYGYVERIFEPDDRRIIKIRPTAKGDVLVKKINQQRRQLIIDVFGNVSEHDRGEYLRIIIQIRDILTRQTASAK